MKNSKEYNEFIDKLEPLTEEVLDDMMRRHETLTRERTLKRMNRIQNQIDELKKDWQL